MIAQEAIQQRYATALSEIARYTHSDSDQFQNTLSMKLKGSYFSAAEHSRNPVSEFTTPDIYLPLCQRPEIE